MKIVIDISKEKYDEIMSMDWVNCRWLFDEELRAIHDGKVLEPCEDAISRQAVLDIVDSYSESQSNVEDVTQDIISDIVALPPVNPQPCENAISRQSAIFLASDLKQDLPDDEHLADMVMAHNEGVLEYQTQLSLLPPVTPQPKTSHWIDDKCSVCGKGIEDLIDSREWYRNESPKYCPFCGIKVSCTMQESEDKK